MLRLTLRNLAANKARFAMTTFAVVLGVGFVVASFVLSDGLRSTFGDLSEEITGETDLVVRPASEFGEPLPLDEALVADITALDGVANAVAFVEAPENGVQPVKADGSTITAQGPPQLMFSWTDDAALGSFTVVAGEAPDEPGEFTMDLDAAATHEFVIGESYDLITPIGVEENVTLVGTTSFGEDNATVGATLMHVSLAEAQRIFGEAGTVDSIPIRLESGADAAAVTAAIASTVDLSSVEIIDQATITAEQEADFNAGINIVGNVLLGFAIVSLFVSIFIIYNTFAIVLGQRVREIGLLRAIGANAVQLRRSIILESVIVGVVASAIGILAGVGIAQGLIALFDAIGAELPDSPTIVAARTVVFALVLGVGVTVISAIAPARQAASISPIQALRDGGSLSEGETSRRLTIGVAGLVVGLALGAFGLFVGGGSTLGTIFLLGGAATSIFLGAALAAPAVARPVTTIVGWPIGKAFGTAGTLAQENAARNPRRTATTGAALMIGLSLVTTGYVVGESIKSSLGDLIDSSVTADYVITNQNEAGLAPTISADLAETGNFAAVAGMREADVRLGDGIGEVTGTDLQAVEALFSLDITQGATPGADVTDAIMLSTDRAADLGVGVGDTVPIEFVSGYTDDLTVAAIYDDATIFDEPLVAEAVLDAGGAADIDDWIAAVLADDVSLGDAAPAIAELQIRYPQVDIQTSSEFQQSFEDTIDQLLLVINALLALAVIIALIGIANTLALSVHERTREIGLLRAVGMTRRQTRRMVRWEAALVALFGAVLGVTIGVVFGWGVVEALPEDGFGGTLAIPVISIIQVVAIATVATLAAAWFPARRAGKLNVLDAISH
ncbi:MAG: FtsX-like permease family protein [Actinomycetota bacterium]